MAETDSATKVMEKDPARADPLDSFTPKLRQWACFAKEYVLRGYSD